VKRRVPPRPRAAPGPAPRSAQRHVGGEVRTTGDVALAERLAQILGDVEEDVDRYTHGFHAYPARMHPDVARNALAAFGKPRTRVLDPFCGSGTVLVEALAAGLGATGVDLSALAVRLARIKCARPGRAGRAAFLATVDRVTDASTERVRDRVDARAPIPPRDVHWYDGHVLKELAGLREEIIASPHEGEREAMLLVLSAIIVKFSRQRADTSPDAAPKRIRKGLPTEFFRKKARELESRWRELEEATPPDAPAPRVVEGDARGLRELLAPKPRFDLVLTSPPYGGTYDYVDHHVRRYPWLGIDPAAMQRGEIGARRRLRGEGALDRWDRELAQALEALARVLDYDALVLMLIGDAQIGVRRLDAHAQIARLAPASSLRVLAAARARRPDFLGGEPRREHLIALAPARGR
jgi:16S rRNA G966 N2-methylase RsmD